MDYIPAKFEENFIDLQNMQLKDFKNDTIIKRL